MEPIWKNNRLLVTYESINVVILAAVCFKKYCITTSQVSECMCAERVDTDNFRRIRNYIIVNSDRVVSLNTC